MEQKIKFLFIVKLLFVAFLVAFVSPLVHCQVDITPSRSDQAFIVLGRNLQWGVSGTGAGDCSVSSSACGFNNNFVFPSLYPQESIAVAIFNSSTANVTFRIKISSTNDPGVTQFQTNQARWSPPLAFSGVSNVATGQITINAGTWGNFYAQVSGASRIAIILSNSAVNNNGADITVSQIQTQSSSTQPGNIAQGQNLGSTNALNPGSSSGSSATVYRIKQPTTAANADGPLEVSLTANDVANSSGVIQLNTAGAVGDSSGGSSSSILATGGFLYNGGPTATGWERARSIAGTSPGVATGIQAVGITQNVLRDANNTTTVQLAGAATFTGACQSTLGVSSYQVNIVTDQPGTLIVDQFKSATCAGSPDTSTPSITVPASTPTSPLMALTFQMTNENVRVRFTNNGGGATTTLSITSELCPLCVYQTTAPPITSSAFNGNSLNVGAPITEKGGRWSITNSATAASGVQGTIGKAAGGASIRHIVDCISWSADSAAAVVAANTFINLRDGASGAGSILWQFAVSFPAAAGLGINELTPTSICGLGLIGTANTAMTIEFAAAVAGSIQSVNATGYDVH